MGKGSPLNVRQALDYVKKKGVVLCSAKGPVPSLAERIAGKPIRGSWWAHPKGREIYRLTSGVAESKDVLTCGLVLGKVTFVHKRLWPALVKLSDFFPRKNLAWRREVHMPSGEHRTFLTAYPKWVPPQVRTQASKLSMATARRKLGLE